MDKRFTKLLKEWRERKGNIIPLFQQTQEIFGVATFYAQFRFSPQGKHTIKICHGTACHVNGAEAIDVALKTELGVASGETTQDGLFTVENVACLGCCSLAPVVMIAEEVEGRLNWSKLLKTIRKIQNNEHKAD
jgi:NADH-quinone oxidoreductase subunit E